MSSIVYLTEKEIYKDNEKLTPLVTEISWTNNLIILSGAKTDEERENNSEVSLKVELLKF